jgi:ribose transport system permease protein
MSTSRGKVLLPILHYAPLILFAGVLGVFAALSSKFLVYENLVNILIQSSSAAIVAIGMTFVLLTAGIDLSVGAIMFLSAAIAGKMILGGYPLLLALAAIVGIGGVYGALNASFITRFGILPFIVTLSMLFAGRGLSLLITQTRAMNLPSLVQVGSAKVLGVIPFPVLVFLVVLVMAQFVLTRTPFGRQVYAVGNDLETAKKAGINTRRVLFAVYVISGLCAAVGGLVLLSQLGAVSPTFGYQREFAAIAAAVLGGTSLFGGRGKVFPGTVVGAILIQTVENGLVIVNADPYIYPLITSGIIFLAVFIDSVRHTQLQQLKRRKIRVEASGL